MSALSFAFSFIMYFYSRLSLSRSPTDSLKCFENIRTSTYQICSFEGKKNKIEHIISQICNFTPVVREILKILLKRVEIAPEDFHVKTGTRFSLPDTRLFEISHVEITRVDCFSFLSSLVPFLASSERRHKMTNKG